MPSNPRVVVLGGGVVGLQVAVSLLEAGYSVKVVAEYLPGNVHHTYASPMAGAMWLPSGSGLSQETCEWNIKSYKAWDELYLEDKSKAMEAGVHKRQVYNYWNNPTSDMVKNGREAFWYHNLPPFFGVVPSKSLPPDAKFGITFETFCINAPDYLAHLQRRVISLGGRIVRTRISTQQSFAGALLEADLVNESETGSSTFAYVNALGLGVEAFGIDSLVFPTRGQTLFVKGEASKIAVRVGDGLLAYVFPRVGSGYTLLGGTQEVGDWRGDLDPDTTTKILQNCKILAPELLDDNGEFTLLSGQIGLRPSRTGRARVDLERIVERQNGQGMTVAHCYGHGGCGYMEALGSAEKVVSLLHKHRSSASDL